MENQLDHLDVQILSALTQNARIAFSQLAEKLGVSNSLIHQRVRKLKEAGILAEPVFQVRPGKLGYQTCAFIQIMIEKPRYVREIIEQLEQIPEIVECVDISGRYALMVKIYTLNNSHLRDILHEQILSLPGVEGTNTLISFETVFNRTVALPTASDDA